jgi:hypothetical protein
MAGIDVYLYAAHGEIGYVRSEADKMRFAGNIELVEDKTDLQTDLDIVSLHVQDSELADLETSAGMVTVDTVEPSVEIDVE